ncbi:hypothetical protein BDW22DRAFT_1359055 [Trametopsis cervina]|nr:hypothetical protein BDW22DRAFT_1359055 [Trametopsis cervina]
MRWSASVVSPVSSDTEPTVVITFDSGKYVFNSGENTSRAWLQSTQTWRKTKSMFLSSLGTQRSSGLPGLLMFFADSGIPAMNIVGPEGLTHSLASMRSYLYRDTLAVKLTEVKSTSSDENPDPVFRDENLSVYALTLSAREQAPDSARSGLVDLEGIEMASGKRKRLPSVEPNPKRVHLSDEEPHHLTDHMNLRERSRMFGFLPTNLRGSDAQDWREAAVQSMFRRTLGMAAPKKLKTDAHETHNILSVPPFDETSEEKPQSAFSYGNDHTHRYTRLPPLATNELRDTLCYVCVGPRIRGKFDMKKAQTLRIPKGPLIGKLIRGETISFTVDDGKGGKEERTVGPEECVGPSEKPKVVMVIDVPNQDYISSLSTGFTESSFYRQFWSKSEDEYSVSTIFHLCGEGVLEDPRYQDFMNRFPESVHHVIAAREYAPDNVTFTSSGYHQLALNQLDANMFQIPKHQLVPLKSLTDIISLPKNTITLTPGLTVPVRPPEPPRNCQLSEEDAAFHSALASCTPLTLLPATSSAFATAQQQVLEQQHEGRTPSPGDDVVVTPLGTGSATPTKYRNVTANLIQIPNCGNILLDCGEGTWGQLSRLFGDNLDRSTGVWQVLRDLKCIFLSHVHGDHHIGLAKVLAMRQKLNPPPTEPLYVVGVNAVLVYLREMSDIENLGLDQEDGAGVVLILADALNWRSPLPYHSDASHEPWMNFEQAHADAARMCQSLNLRDFIAVDVRHRTRCYGAVIQHQDGWSIVYSADTMPSDNLVEIGMDATLLIHEATMADDQADLAKAKAHSTFSQAVEVGHRMRAKNILLTHFSARYPKLPPSAAPSDDRPDEADTKPVLALAFDLARIRIGDMYKLRAYLPAIEQCFSDLHGDDEATEVPEGRN